MAFAAPPHKIQGRWGTSSPSSAPIPTARHQPREAARYHGLQHLVRAHRHPLDLRFCSWYLYSWRILLSSAIGRCWLYNNSTRIRCSFLTTSRTRTHTPEKSITQGRRKPALTCSWIGTPGSFPSTLPGLFLQQLQRLCTLEPFIIFRVVEGRFTCVVL